MKTKNWLENKELSLVELEAKLSSMQDEIFKLKFRHSASPIKNPMLIRTLRRDIARIKTLITQKSKESK
ncbi:MAG: 50S ribosomal protein L29 [Elusimicrobiota bacterium]|jgi:large subunit ribosomal protein L29|nr:50S ribosomal protein L29 [Elusimicrobiota bacterium]